MSIYQKICNSLSKLLSTELINHQINESYEEFIITYEIKNQHQNHKLQKFPKYQLGKKDDINEKCIICLENYTQKCYKRNLPCNHYFHKKCIDKWILKCKPTCPLCLKDFSNLINE